MRSKVLIISLLISFYSSINFSYACTVFMAVNDGVVFSGTNKDWHNLDTRMFVCPSADDSFGIVYFGYQIPEGFQNVVGINEHGLWYDGASLKGRRDIENIHGKPEIDGELCEKALRECKTVQQVIELYKNYFTPHWGGHSMWADRFGNSVVIEYGDVDVEFIYRKDDYQLMTNFPLCGHSGKAPCNRFEKANDVLTNKALNFNSYMQALKESSQDGITKTVYSVIYNLSDLKAYIFNYHNFDEFYMVDILHLISKGKANISIRDKFFNTRIESEMEKENAEGLLDLRWSGNADLYELFFSTDSLFQETEPIEFFKEEDDEVFFTGLWFILIPLSLFQLNLASKKRFLFAFLISFPILFNSCEKLHLKNPYPKSDYSYSIELELNQGNTYYLKLKGKSEKTRHLTESPTISI